MAISFASGIHVKRSERGLGLRPADIVADDGLRGRRYGVAPDKIERMVTSIRDEGQKQNIVIRKLPDGRPAVKAGFTRLEAARVLAADDPDFLVWCTFEQGSEEDSFRTTLIENLERNELSDIDHAHNHELLRRKYGKNDADIARFYAWNPSKVSRLRKLLLLPETVQRSVHDGDISTASAVLLAELTPDESQAMVARGAVKVVEIEEFIRAKGKPVPASEPAHNEAQETSLNSEESCATTVDVSALPTQDSNVAKQPRRSRQRQPQQVRKLLEKYTGYDSHPVVAVIASGLLDYANGTIDDEQFEQVIRKLEGWPAKVK